MIVLSVLGVFTLNRNINGTTDFSRIKGPPYIGANMKGSKATSDLHINIYVHIQLCLHVSVYDIQIRGESDW